MRLRSRKASAYVGVAMVMFLMPVLPDVVEAKTTYEQQQSTQIETELKQASYAENVSDIVATGYYYEEETGMYSDMAIAIADSHIDVYEQADDESTVIGRMYENGIAEAVEIGTDWTKIVSGNVTGFVKTSALCFNEEAAILGVSKGDVIATITAETADIYSAVDDEEADGSIEKGSTFTAVAKCSGYIAIQMDDNKVYVSDNDVSLNYGFEWAYTIADAEAKEAAEEAERQRIEAARIAAEKEKAEREAKIKAAKVEVGVTQNAPMAATDEEIWLLACVIDWEAGWESYEGKLAVANVVLNRVRNPRYDNSITRVIYAKSQFTGVANGSTGTPTERFQALLDRGPRTQDCIKAAKEALAGVNNIGTYTSFRSLKSANYAAYSKYTIIGNHCFF